MNSLVNPRYFYFVLFNLLVLYGNFFFIYKRQENFNAKIQTSSNQESLQEKQIPDELLHSDKENVVKKEVILEAPGNNLSPQFTSQEEIDDFIPSTTTTRKPKEKRRENITSLPEVSRDIKQSIIFSRNEISQYQVPNIENTPVDCRLIFINDTNELQKAEQIMTAQPKVPIYEETYLEWFKDCDAFKAQRGYIQVPLSEEERDFPLAFSISMYTDVELTERLVRAIYQPQNLYCIHIDTKSSLLIHQMIRTFASCFDNVFVASHLDKVKWGDVSVLLPSLNCMRDLVRKHWGKWKYFINLTGQELPLRTNYELVQIAKIFNGSNDIAGSIARMEQDRVKYFWTHRWSKTYQQTIFYNTFKPYPPPPYKLIIFKGELHGFFARKFVKYIVESEMAREYLKWCWDTGHPSEHYWNTLNYNLKAAAPGGYEGPLDVADEYSYHPAMRAKHWQDQNYGTRECQGKLVRGICVFGLRDIPWLIEREEMFANKFHLTFQHLGYDCVEQLHRNRTKLKDRVNFNRQYYEHLPTVIYGRKNGL